MWAKNLTSWYKENQRSLPWRLNPAPYHTLISEFMAQQTQIKTLIPYYHRWLKKYPTVEAVASASIDDILKSWEGLGYYSRAKNLHKTCQIIVEKFKGEIPSSSEELIKLPGIGTYIAAAIASIAFKEHIAVVDGNVLRVVTRLYGLEDDIGKEKTKLNIQKRLNREIKQCDPGDFNQGLMELGATICTPKLPNCNECPITTICYAKNMNSIEKFPVKQKKPPVPHFTIVVGIIKNQNGKILITKRKANQLLGGLWEFPGGKVKENETLESALEREIKEEVNLNVTLNGFLCKVNHAYSHFKITMHAFQCYTDNIKNIKCNSADNYKWIEKNQLNEFAFPKANRVIIENLIKS